MDQEYTCTGRFIDENNVSLQNALRYHEMHLEVADEAGNLVAHVNLGSLKQPNEATQHLQHALRCAIRIGSIFG